MPLDMLTMSAVDVTVTMVLGLVLLFTWLKERGVRLVGWWGLILLVQAAGLVVCASGAEAMSRLETASTTRRNVHAAADV